MLDTSEGIAQSLGLFFGAFHQALRAWCDVDLVAVDVLSIDFGRFFEFIFDTLGDDVRVDAQLLQGFRRKTVCLPQQRQKDMLHIQLGVMHGTHDALGFLKCFLGFFRKSFKFHWFHLSATWCYYR